MLADRTEYEVPLLSELDEASHQRILSVMPLLTRKIKGWLKALRPRERAQYDIDDVLQEVWIQLIRKDAYYDQERAKYTTFSVMILKRFLADLRNRCHVVDSPRDTTARLDSPEDQPAETVECIRQSIRDVGSLHDDLLDRGDDPTFDAAARSHDDVICIAKVKDAVSSLKDPHEIRTLIWSYGLFGGTPMDPATQAERVGSTVADVIQLRTQAERKLAKLMRAREYI